MNLTVYVREVHQVAGKETLVKATNGGPDGPPCLVFGVSHDQPIPTIGQPIHIRLETES